MLGSGQAVLAAGDIGVPEHVALAIVSRNRGRVSLDAQVGDGTGIVACMASDEPSQTRTIDLARRSEWTTSVVSRCMSRLSDRESDVLVSRDMQDDRTSLDDLAAGYGVSRQRIDQIQHSARARMAKAAMAHRDAARAHLSS